jgi:hypothetical protein
MPPWFDRCGFFVVIAILAHRLRPVLTRWRRRAYQWENPTDVTEAEADYEEIIWRYQRRQQRR